MSVKPILFNTEMVKAMLDGRKTVTRRVVKPQPICYGPNITFTPHSNDFFVSAEKGWLRCRDCGNDPEYSQEWSSVSHHWIPPYQRGDILYLRETWQKTYINDGTTHPTNFKYEYKASDEQRTVYRWKPSIHMPKEAARIWLKVTNVRVERLQNITHTQAENEGVGSLFFEDIAFGKERYNIPYIQEEGLSRHQFAYLWDSTIKRKDINHYGWDVNPWVWVIEFERCEKPQEESH